MHCDSTEVIPTNIKTCQSQKGDASQLEAMSLIPLAVLLTATRRKLCISRVETRALLKFDRSGTRYGHGGILQGSALGHMGNSIWTTWNGNIMHAPRHSLSNHRQLDFSVPQLAQANNNENIKTPHYWPFVMGTHGGFPSQRASNRESVSTLWRHHT